MTHSNAPGGARRPALIFIFVTVVLDMLALGLIIPVLPTLVMGFVDGDTGRAAQLLGLFGAIWALMQFLASPVLGALSDRFGRRKVILLSNLGLGLDYVLMALAPSLGWLFVGRLISGITAASFGTASAYIADVTPPEKRAASYGVLGAAFGLGFILGPAFGGICGAIDPRLPFWIAAGLSLLNACYGLFVLPESLAAEHRSASFSWRRANPLGSLLLLRSQPQLLGLATINFISNLAHIVLSSTFVLYAGFRFGWDERTIGLALAGVGVCSALVQGGLVRHFVARFGEHRALVTGLAAGTLGFAIFGFAETGAVFLLGVPVMALWGLTGPALQGLMTRRVAASQQGRLQGAGSSLNGIAQMIGPPLFTQTFAYFTQLQRGWHLPGAPFLLAGILLVAATGLTLRTTKAA